MREKALGIDIVPAKSVEAATGTAAMVLSHLDDENA
jgi:hypothetical protein